VKFYLQYNSQLHGQLVVAHCDPTLNRELPLPFRGASAGDGKIRRYVTCSTVDPDTLVVLFRQMKTNKPFGWKRTRSVDHVILAIHRVK
jgi:hypothetical protein